MLLGGSRSGLLGGQRKGFCWAIAAGVCDAAGGQQHQCAVLPHALRPAVVMDQALPPAGTDYDTRDGTCVRDYIHVMDLGAEKGCSPATRRALQGCTPAIRRACRAAELCQVDTAGHADGHAESTCTPCTAPPPAHNRCLPPPPPAAGEGHVAAVKKVLDSPELRCVPYNLGTGTGGSRFLLCPRAGPVDKVSAWWSYTSAPAQARAVATLLRQRCDADALWACMHRRGLEVTAPPAPQAPRCWRWCTRLRRRPASRSTPTSRGGGRAMPRR